MRRLEILAALLLVTSFIPVAAAHEPGEPTIIHERVKEYDVAFASEPYPPLKDQVAQLFFQFSRVEAGNLITLPRVQLRINILYGDTKIFTVGFIDSTEDWFSLDYTFPEAGTHVIELLFNEVGGVVQRIQFQINVNGPPSLDILAYLGIGLIIGSLVTTSFFKLIRRKPKSPS